MPYIAMRNLHFDLPAERICNWHAQGPEVTHFFNALSLLFPAGERFFIDSVRPYRKRIEEPELAEQVAGFIGQEAMHTREHLQYNDLLESAGLPAHKLDRRLGWYLGLLKKWLPASSSLAITLALEHYTATLADLLLRDRRQLGDSVPGYVQLWTWHALEEVEHKAVCFDVWNRVIRRGPQRYLRRCLVMLSTTLIFWLVVFDFHLRLLLADRNFRFSWRGGWRLLKFLYAPGGIFPGIARAWLDYFRPGFHPWQYDNRAHLGRLDALVEAVSTNRRR